MVLRLIREPSRYGSTQGSLYVDGRWHCWTLEDENREIPGVAVAAWKVTRETAIPAGAYQVRVTRSQRFARDLPELVDVPGFSGVRIHSGNTCADTDGCILVGTGRTERSITGSRVAEARLMESLLGHLGPIAITIENPRVFPSTAARA